MHVAAHVSTGAVSLAESALAESPPVESPLVESTVVESSPAESVLVAVSSVEEVSSLASDDVEVSGPETEPDSSLPLLQPTAKRPMTKREETR